MVGSRQLSYFRPYIYPPDASPLVYRGELFPAYPSSNLLDNV